MKSQSDKFKEAAREFEADAGGKRWDERLKKIVRPHGDSHIADSIEKLQRSERTLRETAGKDEIKRDDEK